MTDYFFSVCFSIQLWFYGTGSLFELIIMLKKKMKLLPTRHFPDGPGRWIKSLVIFLLTNPLAMTRSPTALDEM